MVSGALQLLGKGEDPSEGPLGVSLVTWLGLSKSEERKTIGGTCYVCDHGFHGQGLDNNQRGL